MSEEERKTKSDVKSDLETESEQSDVEAELEQSEAEAELEQSEAEAEPERSDTETEPEQSELDTEPDKSEVDTEPDKSEVDTEHDKSDIEAEPELSDVENEHELLETPEEQKEQELLETPEEQKEQEQEDDEQTSYEESSKTSLAPSSMSEESTKSAKETADEQRLKHIFARPKFAEPRHPIFSSPFARHISAMAFGPKKPKWYKMMTTAQLYLFKDIMNYVEVGRENYFRFNDFLEALQDFDPTVTRAEVLDVIDNMDMNEFEELDFGKFLFLLAYRDQSEEDYPDNIEEKLSRRLVTPRQSLILSAIAYFVLIASPEEIRRYYFANTRRKATVLHHHMEAQKLCGLTERQMEVKQQNAARHLGPLYQLTGSPYALPVPFIPCFKQGQVYKEWKKRARYPTPILPFSKRPIARPIIPFKIRRELGEKITFDSELDELASKMKHGKIPLPLIRFPAKKLREMRETGYSVELKDYIMEKAAESLKKFNNKIKGAAVVYARKHLKPMLREGFPTKHERDTFIEIYQRYLPIKVSDMKNYSLWVRPAGYGVSHKGRPLYPDKFAFGRKIDGK